MNEETTTTETEERVPRPEEIVETYEELPENQKVGPLRCRMGSGMDNPCPRDATTWLFPGDRDYPLCAEHFRAHELWLEAGDQGAAEEITRDWLRIARAWGFETLEQLAINAHENAKEESLKADARAELAQEIADAPRKGRKERMAELTLEQDAESRRLLNRSAGLNNARTALEDYATGEVPEENLRRTLAVLIEEGEKANEECRRYHEEIGIRPE